MVMTLSDALGDEPRTLWDFVMAQQLFPIVKHGLDEDAEDQVDAMTNMEFLEAISLGMERLLERVKEEH